ncbi:hypothetical protein [Flavobacterium sp. ZB4P13]|uniref:hypothetical protein n=1 Tax=Flavobacterium sp. ZB4P13 TaxID=3401728 RepID=UPI003AACBAAB
MTNHTKIEKTPGLNLFNSYLADNKHQAKDSKINDLYYHVNVVAEAYSKGFADGENTGKKDFLDKLVQSTTEKFIEKANQVYLCTKSTLTALHKEQYPVHSFYINIFHQNPKVIIVVPNEILLNDDFVELSYMKIHEVKCSFSSLFNSTLDMGIMGCEDLDEKLLEKDGFDYSEYFN